MEKRGVLEDDITPCVECGKPGRMLPGRSNPLCGLCLSRSKTASAATDPAGSDEVVDKLTESHEGGS